MSDTERLKIPESVVFRSFESETLVLNLDTGQYHGLNDTGGRMLELLEPNGGDVEAAIAALAAEYEIETETIAGDMRSFLAALLERGLVEQAGEGD